MVVVNAESVPNLPLNRPRRRTSLAALFATLFATTTVADVNMSLDRNPVQINETFTLSVKTDEVDADEPALDLPDGIELLRRNTISSRSIVNGKISAERTWRYSLVGRRVGEFVFPAIHIGRDKAAPLSITVRQAGSDATAVVGNQPILLKATVDQTSLFVQQQLLLTVQLLRNVPVRFAQLAEPQLQTPALIQKLGNDSEYDTTINGVSYLVIERRYAIFPQQSGELVINPIHFQGDVTTDPQQTLFGAFNSSQPVNLQTQAIVVAVQDAVQGSPPLEHWLPAQQLRLTDVISSGPYRAGEPLTWTVTLTADGVLPAQLPELAPTASSLWRVYPDQAQDMVQVIASGVRTVRSQKFALVPSQPGDQSLPGLTLPWWRLPDSSAQVATLEPHTLTIAADPNHNGVLNTRAAPMPANAKLPIESVATSAEPASKPGTDATTDSATWWPWLAALFAALWLVTVALWWWAKSRAKPDLSQAKAELATSPETSSVRALTEACKCHDASASRDHLLRLTAASSLSALAQQFGQAGDSDAAVAVRELDHALYGPPPQRWQGVALAAVLPRLLKSLHPANQPKREPDLPPLYPTN